MQFQPNKIKSNAWSFTFEFYIEGGKLYCIYNNNEPMLFQHLITSKFRNEVVDNLKKVCDDLIRNYLHDKEIENIYNKCKGDWKDFLIQVIAKKFPNLIEPLDIMIKSSGKIEYNFESRKKNKKSEKKFIYLSYSEKQDILNTF